MSGNRFKTMSDIQQQCDDCQFCRNCDPSRGQPQERPRICEHNQRMAFIASNHRCLARTAPPGGRTLAGPQPGYPPAAPSAYNAQMVLAQHPQGYALAPGTLYGNTRVGQYSNPQQGQFAERPQDYPGYIYGNNLPGQYPNPQYGSHGYQPPLNRPSEHDDHDAAGQGDLYDGARATGHARAHWGGNYAEERRYRRGTTYRNIVVGDDTVTHSGDNIGYKETEMERMAKIPHLPKDNGRTDYGDRRNAQ